VDEGWELWVVEGERKVVCVARVSVDEAVERAPWRRPDCIDCRKSQDPHFVQGFGLAASRRAARRMGELGVPAALSISASGVPRPTVWSVDIMQRLSARIAKQLVEFRNNNTKPDYEEPRIVLLIVKKNGGPKSVNGARSRMSKGNSR